jgi:4-oxalocrotonate tautomerase
MPFIQVHMLEGRTDEQKEALIAALTEAALTSIGAPVETVRVLITEVPLANWGLNGTTMQKVRAEKAAGTGS